MSGSYATITNVILRDKAHASQKLDNRVRQLSSGVKVQRPGDDVIAFQKIANFEYAQSSTQAEAQTMQARINWYRASSNYLHSIREVLTAMSQLAIQASSSATPAKDREVLDSTFQEYKRQVSEIIDGQGGTLSVAAQFRGVPLFIGYTPPSDVGSSALIPPEGVIDFNLYTGFGRAGFETLDLPANGEQAQVTLSGTATAGSINSITLDAPPISNAYKGMEIEITGGTGAGQTVTIIGFDAETKIAQVNPPFVTAPDNTSTYIITHPYPNHSLNRVGAIGQVSFSSITWGADNDRQNADTFRALTDEEVAYRQANSIPDTVLEPQTDAEWIARRHSNIFDPEFGSLSSAEKAVKMLEQVENAIKKITVYSQRSDAKAEAIQFSYESSETFMTLQAQAKDVLKGADFAEASAEYQALQYNSQSIMGIAARRDQLFAALTRVMTSGR